MFAHGFYLDGRLPTALQMWDVFSFVFSFKSTHIRRLMVNSRKYQVLYMLCLVLNRQRSIMCVCVCVYTLFSTHRLRLKVMSERVRLGQSHDPVAKKASHFMLP